MAFHLETFGSFANVKQKSNSNDKVRLTNAAEGEDQINFIELAFLGTTTKRKNQKK
jgi:hypothetical protein